jgi:hypothetical protein
MRTVIIVSKCLRIIKSNYHFHFKGSYAGHLIRGLCLSNEKKYEIGAGEEYLMWVEVSGIEAGILRGRILKLKRLDACWDRS